MAKTNRRFINLDWADSSSCLRAQDIPYDASNSIKDKIDDSYQIHTVSGYSSLPSASSSSGKQYLCTDSGMVFISDGSSWRFVTGTNNNVGNDASDQWWHICRISHSGNYNKTLLNISFLGWNESFNIELKTRTDGSATHQDWNIGIYNELVLKSNTTNNFTSIVKFLRDSSSGNIYDLWVYVPSYNHMYLKVNHIFNYSVTPANITWYQNTHQSSEPTGVTAELTADFIEDRYVTSNGTWWKRMFTGSWGVS